MKRILTLVLILCSSVMAFSQGADCASGTVIPINTVPSVIGTFSGNNTGATASNTGGFLDGCLSSLAPVNDVWYTFTMPAGSPAQYKIIVDGGFVGANPALAVYRGFCAGPLILYACTNSSPAAIQKAELILTLDGNSTYFIRVTDYNTGGPLNITGTIEKYVPPILVGAPTATTCQGKMYDDGGATGNYGPSKNLSTTINPSGAHTGIELTLASYAFEDPSVDGLSIYYGTSVDPDSLYQRICGSGSNRTITVPTSGGITIQFRSDGAIQLAGFEMDWLCVSTAQQATPVSNCVTGTVVPSLPFTQTGKTTCGAGNNFDIDDACGSTFMQGEDFVYKYTSPGNECINIRLTNTGTDVGLFVMDGCPLADATQCLAKVEESAGNNEIQSVNLPTAGTYYIVVSSQVGACAICTGFDILVQSAPCPLDVDDNVTADSMVQTIAAQGVLVQNSVLTCPQGAYGVFSGGMGDGTNFMDGGIILSTGSALGLEGPSSIFTSTQLASGGDAFLTALAGQPTQDKCILEFDVYAPGDKLVFDYLFTSEEYNEFVNTAYNDIFAFLISGPGILNGVNEQNLAYVPNTTTPITINTVNNGNPLGTNPSSFPQYYVNNVPADGFALNELVLGHDGHTKILTAEADVVPCNWYHVRLAIADGTDQIFDSGVLIGANSLFANAATISSTAGTNTGNLVDAAENCQDGSFTIDLLIAPPAGDSAVIVLNIAQDPTHATEGVDYAFIPDSVVFYPNQVIAYFPNGTSQVTPGVGQTSYTINIVPVVDGVVENSEPVVLYLLSGCATPEPYDSAVIVIHDELIASLPPVITLCGEPIPMPLTGSGLNQATWHTSYGLSDSTAITPLITAFEDTTYSVVVSNAVCSLNLSTYVIPYLVVSSGDTTMCEDGVSQITTTTNLPGFTFSWSPTAGLSCTDCASPTVQNAPIGTNSYVVTFVSADGSCTGTNTVDVTILDIPAAQAGDDATICEGETATIGAAGSAGVSYTWLDAAGNAAGNGDMINVTPAATETYTVTAENGQCADSDDVTITVLGTFTLATNSDETINLGESVNVSTTVTPVGSNPIGTLTYSWTPTTGLSCADCADPVITPSETTLYTLTVSSSAGCSESASFTIEVIPPNMDAPNSFTPNGDNVNDMFNLVSSSNSYQVETFNIFDRWGNLVYTTTTQTGWDGTSNGKNMPQDTYIYNIVVRLPDGSIQEMKGEVLLVR